MVLVALDRPTETAAPTPMLTAYDTAAASAVMVARSVACTVMSPAAVTPWPVVLAMKALTLPLTSLPMSTEATETDTATRPMAAPTASERMSASMVGVELALTEIEVSLSTSAPLMEARTSLGALPRFTCFHSARSLKSTRDSQSLSAPAGRASGVLPMRWYTLPASAPSATLTVWPTATLAGLAAVVKVEGTVTSRPQPM